MKVSTRAQIVIVWLGSNIRPPLGNASAASG